VVAADADLYRQQVGIWQVGASLFFTCSAKDNFLFVCLFFRLFGRELCFSIFLFFVLLWSLFLLKNARSLF